MTEPRRPTILAVDDATDLLALMAKALGADYGVVTADNGAKALKAAKGEPRPDLILLDVEMPGTSGFDVCKALKAEPRTSDIPIIFLTGKTEAQAHGAASAAAARLEQMLREKLWVIRETTISRRDDRGVR